MQRLGHIDALRGFAALIVCWYHITQGGKLLEEGTLREISALGHLGVDIFFVISGFVIPFSMWKDDYRLNHFPSFMWRRLLRVHPPFLIACLIAIALNLISMRIPGYAGTLPQPYLPQALKDLAVDGTYLTAFLNRPTILVVAWTLAIEVQFYLLAGILVHLMRPERERLLAVGLIALSCSAFLITDGRWIFPYLPVFTLGWCAAWLHVSGFRPLLPKLVLGALLVISFGRSFPSAISAVAAFLFIVLWRGPIAAPWKLLGTISYSLYLVHVPVGGRAVNLLGRFSDSSAWTWTTLVVATAISLIAAWLFWKTVEAPILRLSRQRKKLEEAHPVPSEA